LSSSFVPYARIIEPILAMIMQLKQQTARYSGLLSEWDFSNSYSILDLQRAD